MHFSNVFSLCVIGTVYAQNCKTTGQLGDAPVVTNNPIGKQAVAILTNKPFFDAGSLDENVKGSIRVVSGAKGVGVDYTVSLSNLPTEGGPFIYHIHDEPVDAAGNCTNTKGHLDPFIRGEDPPCNSTYPWTCQVGDISGKYGKITSDPFTAQFHDDFTSMTENLGTYFLNRSIVVHFANKTRITCANFTVLDCTTNATITSNGSCQQNSTPVTTPVTTPSTLPVQGGARAHVVVKGLGFLSVVVLAFGL
ncbi:superoxide dismutase [Poronia punctata]|nr:superoxide dismutase [Poronia punctata]